MKLWRQISAGAAASLLLLVAACAMVPASEQPAAHAPSASFPTATIDDQSQSPSPSAAPSASASMPSAAPSTTPMLTASPEPTPDATPDPTPDATPLASLTSGPLRVDGLALVVADELRVRSAPGTGDRSVVRGEPITKGREVFVVAGPVSANGYDWWQVQALTGLAHFGWVASAARDGETWLAYASMACPRDTSLTDLARIGGARSLVCYGRSDLRLRAFREQFCGDGTAAGSGSPDWIYGVFSGDRLLARKEKAGEELAPEIYGRAHPSLLKSAAEFFGCNDAGTGWFDLTGHFDDPVSSQCRFVDSDPTTGEPVDQEAALSITDCRQRFVYTELRPASGPN
ncbi:MAG: hypothetical protein QOJ75_733 [Chloroflexota bacterium]|nr:hypothetical protein [Chloroflexota bacterium]